MSAATGTYIQPALPNPLEIARRHHAQGQLLHAAKAYRQALQNDSSNQTALLGLSLIARQSSQHLPALNMAQAALTASPASSPAAALARAHIGHCLFALRQIPQAQFAFHQALVPTAVCDEIQTQAQLQAHIGLGELYVAAQRSGLALVHFESAIALQPNLAAAHYGLGNVYALKDNFVRALPSFHRAVELIPTSPEAHFALAFTLSKLARHPEAVAAYRRAVTLRPSFASAWINLGVALIADGRDHLADLCYQQAIVTSPPTNPNRISTRISAFLNLGHLERTRRRFHRAREHYDHALRLASELASGPDSDRSNTRLSEVHLAFAYLHLEQQQFPQASQSLEAAESTLAPDCANPEIPNARGILHLAEDSAKPTAQPSDVSSLRSHLKEAITAFEQAEAQGHKTAASNRGNTLLRLGRCNEALDAHQSALALDPHHPGVRYNLALTQLRLGDFANGWRNYEIRWSFREVHPRPRRFTQPRWQGEPLSSPASIFIYSEQGLGDTIQFIRYLTLVAQRLSDQRLSKKNSSEATMILPRIIVEVQPTLIRLLTSFVANLALTHPNITAEIIPHGQPLPDFTHHCPLMSLPALFQTTRNEMTAIPAALPGKAPHETGYLKADIELIASRAQELTASSPGLGPIVGLAWAGNPNYRADKERSTRLETFLPLLEIPGIRCVSLQKDAASQIHNLPQNLCLYDGSLNDQDLADTAALIANLDLIITTDTAVAHLAGALGKPMWLLLPWQSDWRWMQEIPTTPWYPTARLFRQSSPGNWPELIQHVASELRNQSQK